MQCEWLGERVATVDVDRAIKNVIHNKEDAGWGPNAVFRFPLEGGTGGIWKGVARLLPQDKQVSTYSQPKFSPVVTKLQMTHFAALFHKLPSLHIRKVYACVLLSLMLLDGPMLVTVLQLHKCSICKPQMLCLLLNRIPQAF